MGSCEVCLANIDCVYQVNGERKKRLLPGTNVVSNVKTLQIVCKVIESFIHSFIHSFVRVVLTV